MNRVFGTSLLISALAVSAVTSTLAESGGAPGGRDGPAPQVGVSTTAEDLAAQISEINRSTLISRAKKEKRISTAVRVAVVAATAYRQNPSEVLGIGLEFAAVAARAALSFAEAIANAVSFAPPIARIDGASSQIRTATFAAAKAPGDRRAHPFPAKEYARIAPPTLPDEALNPSAARASPSEQPAATESSKSAVSSDRDSEADARTAALSGRESRGSSGGNSAVSLTADVGVQYDDNIFWSKTSKVGDTIYSVSPGADYHFGQNSLAHGSVSYREAFTRYAKNSTPNVNLGTGAADFGFSDEKLTLDGTASYSQLDQNNSALLPTGGHTLLRSDLLALGASAESNLLAKISARIGGNYSLTEFKTTGLINSRHFDVPLNLYYQTTPKLDLSVGASYGEEMPEGAGPNSRDLYYNVGLRGSLAPKLTGNFSVGYRTRNVPANPSQRMLGFDGSFNYELTPKTTAALSLSRDFNTSPLGQTLVSGSYGLSLTTAFNPQWQATSRISYQTSDYGNVVFAQGNALALPDRRVDNYWEGRLQLSYLYARWLSASANYTFRSNQSTIPLAEFSNNLVGLTLGLRY